MRWACLLVVACGTCVAALPAAEVYQWKDDAGRWHFTDDPSAIPPEYRSQGARRHLKEGSHGGGAISALPAKSASRGEQLWRSKCASCHFLNGNGLRISDGKRGLQRFILNPATGFPFNRDQIVPRIRRAVDGRTSDMPPVSLTDEELDTLVSYLISRFK